MSHPILPFMPAVFVPVRDLKRSTEWYADLLGRQLVPQSDQDSHGIYIFDFEGTQIILDGNTWGSPPTIMFDTNDIDASRAICEGLEYETMTDIFRDEYISVFNMNNLMICQAHRDPESAQSKSAHALLGKISHFVVHTDNLQDTVGWYEKLLARSVGPDVPFGELSSIRMDRGPRLLIDDNSLSQSSPVFYDQLKLELRANPIAIIESTDLSAALDHVRAKGAISDKGIESRLGVSFFMFYDPDGNGFMVYS